MKEKIMSFSRKDVMSCRNEVFGICAIWIVLFHIYGNIGIFDFPGSSIAGVMLAQGNAGVDIFLFLSSIGLYSSMSKNTVPVFYKNRVVRLLIPYLLLAIPYFIWYDFAFAKDGIAQFLLNLSTLNFWITGDHPVWYVAAIIIFYAIYPWVHKLDAKTKSISTVALIVLSVIAEFILLRSGSVIYTNAERALSRLPIFFFGVLSAKYVLTDKAIAIWKVIAAALIGITVFTVIAFYPPHLVLVRYLYGVMGICIITVYSFMRKVLPLKYLYSALAWLGTISLEIYVVHVFILRIIKSYQLWDDIPYKAVWYLIIVFAALVFAKLLAIASNGLKLKKNKKIN